MTTIGPHQRHPHPEINPAAAPYSFEPHDGKAHLDPQSEHVDRGNASRSPADQFSREQCSFPGDQGNRQDGNGKPESAELPAGATRPSDDAPPDGLGKPSPDHNDWPNKETAPLVPSMLRDSPEEKRKAAFVAAETCQFPQAGEHRDLSLGGHHVGLWVRHTAGASGCIGFT